MADRLTRSSARAIGVIPNSYVAQPFRVSKRKLKKDLTDEEKEEVKKHEIKGNGFTYRLKSIRQILNEKHSDAEANGALEGSQRKKRRRSSIRRSARKSIVKSTLTQNAKMDEELQNAKVNGEIRSAKADEEIRNAKLDENIKSAKTSEEMQIAKVNEEMNNSKMDEEKEKANNQKSAMETVTESTESISKEKSQNKINDKQQSSSPINEEKDPPDMKETEKKLCEEEDNQKIENEMTEEQKEEALKKRQKALETLKKLQNEQMEWAKLLKKHEDKLSEEQKSAQSFEDGRDFLTEEQREFLENRIAPEKFLDQLQNQADEFCGSMEYLVNFASKLNRFKEHAVQYIKGQTENIAKKEFEIGSNDIDTPRRLITKIVKSNPE